MKRVWIVVMMMGAGALSIGAQSGLQLAERGRLLEAELSLAKSRGTYMILDIENRTLALKARGLVLRQWAIEKTRIWGKGASLEILKMERKSALAKPERPNITPGKEAKGAKDEENKDTVDLGILELIDMPVHFSLHFGKNIHVSVRPRTKRFWPALMNIGKSISWHTFLPLKTIWFALLKNKAFTEIELIMPSEKDAQSIYWSFLDGQSTLIIQR